MLTPLNIKPLRKVIMQRNDQPDAASNTKGPSSTSVRGALLAVFFFITSLLPDRFKIPPLISQYLGGDTTQAPHFVIYAATVALVGVVVWLTDPIANIISNLLQGIPGPRLAKLTIGWKLIHVRNGTYTKKLRELHQKYGVIVQVGPHEYSVGNPQQLQEAPSLYTYLFETFHPQTLETLGTALKMANIFRYEANIDKCNHALLHTLTEYVHRGEEVDMADLVTRYAYDTLFSTTVGQSPGFLNHNHDISKLIESVENWKFYAILYGSYLRFHPFIARILWVFSGSKDLKSLILEHLDIDPNDGSPSVFNQMRDASEGQPKELKHILEACIALMVSASDPAITHILASLFFTFREPELVEALRDEISRANLSETPKIKELIHAKPRMPLLYAVLDESLRLIQPRTNRLSYVSPNGGVMIGGKHVPEGVSSFLPISCDFANSALCVSQLQAAARLPNRCAMSLHCRL